MAALQIQPKSRLATPQTLHGQLRDDLRTDILRGRYAPGAQIPTETEMISSYGVSKITVRRAIQDLTTEGLLVGQRGRGTFVNPSKFSTVATFLFVHAAETPPQLPYTQMLINGVNSENNFAQPFRLELIARPCSESQTDDDDTVEQLVEHAKISGVIALPRLRETQVRRLRAMGVPVAIIEHTDYEQPEGVVTLDLGPTTVYGQQARHLKEIGSKRVGIITDHSLTAPMHVESVRGALRDAGILIIEEAFERVDVGINDAHAATLRLLTRHPDLDAIIAIDDLAALGVLHACIERGIRVPDQMAIIGCGNTLGEHSHCGITTIDTHLERRGKLAVRSILRILAGEQVEPHIYIEPTLLRRNTSTR